MSERSVEEVALRYKQFLDGFNDLADKSELTPPMLFRILGLYARGLIRENVDAGIGTAGVLAKSVIGNFAQGLGLEVELREDIQDKGTLQ